MRGWLPVLCMVLVGFRWSDPAPSLLRGKAASRNLICERTDVNRGAQLRPGHVAPEAGRGDYIDRSVLLCTERLMRPGLRHARDEAVLQNLDERSDGLATLAKGMRPDLSRKTWLVETHYPSAQVSAKLSFAAKNALMRHGLAVSDRVPTLNASDVEILLRMDPEEAFPAACQRYVDNGTLTDGDALLVVIMRDLRETILHAGLCHSGTWKWLR